MSRIGTQNWNKIVIRRVFSGVRVRNRAVLPRFLPELDVYAGFCDQKVAVKSPRFRIAEVMAFVAIAALNFTAIRAVWEYKPYDLLAIGALPTANVLVVGLLIAYRRRGSRPFLLGFEAFGAIALAVYIAGMSLFPKELGLPFIDLVVKPYVTTFGPILTTGYIVILYSLVAVILGLPQLALAVLGGLFSLRFWASERPDRTRC
jgi:hypothetical protein